ncbi:hypothetical protein KW805_02085 [Candidatus Pacearchaeota archaeon]|nr:hypothetical protein [Candidatus Pacearchaeota archaeon]
MAKKIPSNTIRRIQRITRIDLDTLVKEAVQYLPEQGEMSDYGNVDFYEKDLPHSLRKVDYKDVFYIDEPVKALTTRAYLMSKIDNQLSMGDLFTEEGGDFYPVNAEYLKSLSTRRP